MLGVSKWVLLAGHVSRCAPCAAPLEHKTKMEASAGSILRLAH